MSITDALLEQALALPLAERARLANCLLASLGPDETGPDPDHKSAWVAEIEARLRDVEEGRATLIPWEEIKARLRPIQSRAVLPERA